MAYLQPWMWWALPAIFLPLIIHLLNRLRYRTVHWGAMIFLLKANRAATRRAKIRQYLLLACRMLIVLFLIWAMTRPLIGGWLGAAAGGAPEAVLILLDRSASMEARVGEQLETKRVHGLSLLAQAAKQSAGSRFVLIENVLREPLEIADATRLGTMQLGEATDAAADLPTMLRVALDYLVKNKPGSAEVWIASDLQASNWRPESAEWQDIAARFAGLPQGVRVRILDLSAPPERNVSVAMKNAELRLQDPKAEKAQLNLSLELKVAGGRKGALPLLVTREGAKSQTDLTLNAPVQRHNLRFDLATNQAGWGKVELPADDSLADNAAYFVYARPKELRAAIVGEGTATLRLRLAAAPDKTRTDRTAEIFSVAGAEGLNLKDIALACWTASTTSEAMEKALRPWVEGGGVIVCFPPGGESATGPLGVGWSSSESAPNGAPFRVTAWDELDGPLARTDSGASLPVAQLEIQRRQIPAAGETTHAYATFADGRPFLLGRRVGNGHVFACATLPDSEWSNLGDGFVLLPMVQRLFALGGERLTPRTLAIAGEWRPLDPEQTWSAVETDRRRDWRWHAGVYQNGVHLIALNRPEAEDVLETVDRSRLPELLRDVKVTVIEGALELKADRLQSEIWPAMVVLTMLFMSAEMLLATSKALLPVKAVARTAARGPVAERQPVEARA